MLVRSVSYVCLGMDWKLKMTVGNHTSKKIGVEGVPVLS